MPNQTEAALTRHWSILIALIAQIAGLAERLSLPAATRNHLCHLLRVAEGLARRWLILNARFRSVEKVARAPSSSGTTGKSGTRSGSAAPLLVLVEPNPPLRAEDYSLLPFEPASPRPSHDTPDRDAHQDAPLSPALTRRAQALRDVMARPSFHTARMARWLRRAAIKAQSAFVRPHPLRVGRPPGARRRDRKCSIQAALWWLDKLARDSLEPDWVP